MHNCSSSGSSNPRHPCESATTPGSSGWGANTGWLYSRTTAFSHWLPTSGTRASTVPAFASFLAAVFAFAASRAVSKTTNSLLANCRHTSNPIPRFAPVTSATPEGFLIITITGRAGYPTFLDIVSLEAGGLFRPHAKFIVPRVTRLTCTPERPKDLYCNLLLLIGFTASARF